MKIHYLQHVPFEGLAMIAEWASLKGYSIEATKFYEKAYRLPGIDDFDMLIIIGGPMSVNDGHAYPWLSAEKKLIKQSIDQGKYVLGICLGAQLIADVLGAKVAPMPQKEIGWFPIVFSDAMAGNAILSGLNLAMVVLHWHGERFDMPDNATPLASSAVCDNQGFIYGDRVLALQFHFEMDKESISRIVEACSNELVAGGPSIQATESIIAGATKYPLKRALFQLLDNWLSPVP
ncbi:type 1 glutamine amidotransferase [Vibrio splendidus]